MRRGLIAASILFFGARAWLRAEERPPAAPAGTPRASPREGHSPASQARAEPRETAVLRGDVRAVVYANGTVLAEGAFRLKSTIEGRVEGIMTSSRTWVRGGARLGYLVNGELSAIIDSKGGTDQSALVDRWHPEYAPAEISCPHDCFVTNIFVHEKQHVLPNAHLFEAAPTLKLVARIRPEDAPKVRTGMTLVAWPHDDPRRRIRAAVTAFVLDPQDEEGQPRAGTLEAGLSPEQYLDPDTLWDGTIELKVKKDSLYVPTKALIRYNNAAYLPVLVETGLATDIDTEITGGINENHRILIVEPSMLWSGPQRPPPMPLPALRQEPAPETPAAEEPRTEPAPAKTSGAPPAERPRPAAAQREARRGETKPAPAEAQEIYEKDEGPAGRNRRRSLPSEQMDPDIHDVPPGDEGNE